MNKSLFTFLLDQAPFRGLSGFWAFLILAALLLTSCGSDDGGNGDNMTDFNRQELFTHLGGKIILPAYQEMLVEAQLLQSAGTDFFNQPELPTLTDLRDQYQITYLAFQRVKPFELGPAATFSYRTSLNTYPVNDEKIEENVANNSVDLDLLANAEAKGFPALDYLLFGLGDDQAHLDAFSTGPNAQVRKDYMAAILEEILDKSANVVVGWEADGGDYISTFITNTGTDVGSSLGLLVNEMNFDYELMKNAKIGIPLGVLTLGIPLPEKAEALYSGSSVELALENLEAIKGLFSGETADGENGPGLDDHLDHVDAQHDGKPLSNVIVAQLDLAAQALGDIPAPLSTSVLEHPSDVQGAYNELQRGVVLLKTDLPSALGVLITYQDADGD